MSDINEKTTNIINLCRSAAFRKRKIVFPTKILEQNTRGKRQQKAYAVVYQNGFIKAWQGYMLNCYVYQKR